MPHTRVSFWRFSFAGASAALALLLGGCASTITDMTSETVAENPSQIYTITTRVHPQTGGVVKDSIRAQVVIDGELKAMTQSTVGNDIYELEYSMPPGRTEAKYYILVNYRVMNNGVAVLREEYGPLKTIRLTNRYVYTLDAVRGPIGSRIAVVGRGFTPQDVVYFEGVPTRTVFESANSIAFFVPAVAPGRNYAVTLQGATGQSPVGTFRVDGLALSVTPSALTLRSGEKVSLLFTLSSPAPVGGLLIDVTTDAPKSVIMPEVIIPAGSTSAQVTIQGGAAGSGSLFVSGGGAGETVVPISVSAR